MKQYEITFITKEDEKEKPASPAGGPVKAEIEALGGKILNVSSIGQKNFTYPIKKEKSGIYTTVVFEMDPQKLMDLNKKIGLKEDILRHLIILYKAAKVGVPKVPKILKVPKPEKTLPKEPEKLPEPAKELPKPEVKKPEKIEEKKEAPKKVEKPVEVAKPKVSPAAEEIEKETVGEEERMKELDKKLDELLKE